MMVGGRAWEHDDECEAAESEAESEAEDGGSNDEGLCGCAERAVADAADEVDRWIDYEKEQRHGGDAV